MQACVWLAGWRSIWARFFEKQQIYPWLQIENQLLQVAAFRELAMRHSLFQWLTPACK